MSDEPDQARPSKSARKRAIAALRSLAAQMTRLSDAELQRLGVNESLRDAIQQARALKPSGARERQLKHCVKFMDSEELSAVRTYIEDQQSRRVAANRRMHEIEQWRDRLIGQGDRALDTLLGTRPDLDRQHLRRLCREAIRERETGNPAGAGRRLFRYLRDVLAPTY